MPNSGQTSKSERQLGCVAAGVLLLPTAYRDVSFELKNRVTLLRLTLIDPSSSITSGIIDCSTLFGHTHKCKRSSTHPLAARSSTRAVSRRKRGCMAGGRELRGGRRKVQYKSSPHQYVYYFSVVPFCGAHRKDYLVADTTTNSLVQIQSIHRKLFENSLYRSLV